MIENSKQIKNRTTRPQILKQVQDDVKVGFGRALAFTLAEVLIVIGIIGVVAALTLPNLNHATGDKETVTRLQKAYSILSEANDRAVAIYGPMSTWKSNEQCADNFSVCWMKRIGEFLKISKSCDETQNISCESLAKGDLHYDSIIYQLPDGTTISSKYSYPDCNHSQGSAGEWFYVNDLCMQEIDVDVNGPLKGQNKSGHDIFLLMPSNAKGIMPYIEESSLETVIEECMEYKDAYEGTYWVLEYGNLDYLKADSSGKCNDSNIILDGTTNTSCH